MAEIQTTTLRRTGEKAGWTGGWLGGFLWVFILAVIFLAQNRMMHGLTGLGLFVVAVGAILMLAPWRHPTVQFWKLMLPIYLMLFISIVWAVWSLYNPYEPGLNRWSFFWILPCLIPLFTIGGRRWQAEGVKTSGNE